MVQCMGCYTKIQSSLLPYLKDKTLLENFCIVLDFLPIDKYSHVLPFSQFKLKMHLNKL
jgi:hypothetical protein